MKKKVYSIFYLGIFHFEHNICLKGVTERCRFVRKVVYRRKYLKEVDHIQRSIVLVNQGPIEFNL
jgi:hypothetical protein